MGLLNDVLKLARLKIKRVKEDVHKYVEEELKKEEEREKKKAKK
ncbi:MAG: hypothetical protein QW063_00385 [Candidatus Nanoarchaeia archaeon]